MSRRLAMHVQFFKSLGRLSSTDQNHVRQAIDLVSKGYTGSSLRRHKVGRWLSLSASMDLRIIAVESNSEIVLAHVDHHDSAYLWAQTHKPVVDPDAMLISILPDVTSGAVIATPRHEAKTVAINALYLQLLAAGLPTILAEQLSQLSGSELLDAISWLAPELQEVALVGLLEAESSPAPPPPRPSDILVVNDDQILKFALSLPAATWRVFLHPKQRHIVDLPNDRHLLVRGGPGTGKTVAIAHRFARLSREFQRTDISGPVFIVLNNVTREVLRQQLAKLDVILPEESIRLVSDLPRSRTRLMKTLRQWSHIVVDEGQDLPIDFVSALCELLEDGHEVPPLTISYDANQAIFHPSEAALARLRNLSDVITISYCYRATKQIADAASRTVKRLHKDYAGRDFQHRHHVAGARDGDTTGFISALAGPDVDVALLTSREHLPIAIQRTAHTLLAEYEKIEGLAIIVVATPQDGFIRELRKEIEKHSKGIPVYSYWTSKGQEYFAGLVIDAINYEEPNRSPSDSQVTFGDYKMLSGLYVAMSRFRDRLSVVTFSKSSPAWNITQPSERK